MHNVEQLARLKERFPDSLVVVGVHSAKFPNERLTKNIREAVLREGIRHPVINDANFQVWNAYSVHAWPTVVLVDPEGQIVGSDAGEIQAEEYTPVIEDLIRMYDERGEFDHSPVGIAPEAEREPLRPLNYPAKLLISEKGRLFISDTEHHRIVEVQLDEQGEAGEVLRVFGDGHPGLKDGMGTEAHFNSPHGLAQHLDTLYVADTGNHAIRAIDLSTGLVRTVAGTGEKGFGPYSGKEPAEIPLRSPWALYGLTNPQVEEQNLLFIAMAGSHQIWLLLNEEQMGVFAGNGREALVDGTLAEASFNQPSDLALGMGHLIVADAEASAIRAISLGDEPKVFTLVGQGLFEFGDQDGTGETVRLQHPAGLAYHEGIIYITDTYNHKIKALDPSTGEVRTLAGNGAAGYVDGSFAEAAFNQPEGVVVYQNRLYIADTNNHSIRTADLERQTVSTFRLGGLERLRIDEAQNERITRLEPVDVAPGQFTITLNLILPEGYKLNPSAPSWVIEKTDPPNRLEDNSITITENGIVTLETSAYEDRDLPLEMTLYYCQTDQEQLCLIHDERLILPVNVVPGEADIVNLTYQVNPIDQE